MQTPRWVRKFRGEGLYWASGQQWQGREEEEVSYPSSPSRWSFRLRWKRVLWLRDAGEAWTVDLPQVFRVAWGADSCVCSTDLREATFKTLTTKLTILGLVAELTLTRVRWQESMKEFEDDKRLRRDQEDALRAFLPDGCPKKATARKGHLNTSTRERGWNESMELVDGVLQVVMAKYTLFCCVDIKRPACGPHPIFDHQLTSLLERMPQRNIRRDLKLKARTAERRRKNAATSALSDFPLAG